MTEEDISKKTVAILLLVAIVLSTLGTFAVLNAEPTFSSVDSASGTGQVKLIVGSLPEKIQSSSGKGQIKLIIN